MKQPRMSIASREQELACYLDKQPYMTELDGVTLKIAKNVFPSDFGLTSSFFGAFMLQQQPGSNALDMGCGSGYFAFLLKKIGCANVLGVDFNKDAIQGTLENRQLNPTLTPIDFLHSDLFAAVPPTLFDLIVFNFNYYPSNGTFGLNEDGGCEILERFFDQVGDYINEQTRIYIPYSEFIGAAHDPKNIGPTFGYSVTVEDTIRNHTGEHYIYKIMKTPVSAL
jgi:methylase of polypeptide subunit release factors